MDCTTTTTAEQLATYAECVFEPSDLIELRMLPSRNQEWIKARDLPTMAERLTQANRADNIYVGANPRTRVGGDTAADVALARCLFADFDGGITVNDALASIFDHRLPDPSLVINSGHGVHCYWRLSEPLTDLAEFTRLQKGLAKKLGSDTGIHDPPRIMRLPGFQNVKREPHVPCFIAEVEYAND